MIAKYVFDIPIYRCRIDKHTREFEDEKTKFFSPLFKYGPEVIHSQSYAFQQNYFDREKWYPWRFNEVIGWIRLFTLEDQIKGELWFVKAQRIRKGLKKKSIHYVGEAFRLWRFPKKSSTQIYEKLCSILDRILAEEPLKGRYVDTELFHNIGPYVDWKKLLLPDSKS
jgi:hypothetical protein